MRFPTIMLLVVFAMAALTAEVDDKAKLSGVVEHALQQSQLTRPNARPFHLQANIVETTNPSSGYQAKIEEYWVSPTKWRRVIESPDFSQTLVVNGEAVSEKNVGEYYPWWLNEFVTAIFDPLSPMLPTLLQSGGDMPKPSYGGMTQTCSDLHSRTDRWMVCFDGRGLLQSVFTKGYGVEFRDYKKFADKQVARILENDPEPGTHLQAKITTLSELNQPDEKMFVVAATTPLAERIKTVRVDEDVVRKIAISSTEIEWPSVGEGHTTGGCAVYISADRKGQVREVWPGGCDNAGLEDPLREQVKKWKLRAPVAANLPVQINSLLTFTFNAAQDSAKALPTLSDADVRKLVYYTVEPTFPPGTNEKFRQVSVNISIDETGKITGGGPASQMPNDVFFAAYNAVMQWRFHPYLLNGKPQYFHAVLTFTVK